MATTANQLDLAVPMATKERSMRSIVWHQFRRHNMAVAGLVVVSVLLLGAILVPYISPYPPEISSLQERREAIK